MVISERGVFSLIFCGPFYKTIFHQMLGKLGYLGSVSMEAFICIAVYIAEEVLVMCHS